jgi:hypothetical protein
VLETFDRLAQGRRGRSTAPSGLRARLVARRRALERSAETAEDLRWAGHALRRTRRRTRDLIGPGGARRALADGFARAYRRARRAMKAAWRHETPQAFHAWRKAVKTHAFHVHLLAGAGP